MPHPPDQREELLDVVSNASHAWIRGSREKTQPQTITDALIDKGCTLGGRDAENRIAAAAEAASETAPDWETRCGRILSALGLDFGQEDEKALRDGKVLKTAAEIRKEAMVEFLAAVSSTLKLDEERPAQAPSAEFPEAAGVSPASCLEPDGSAPAIAGAHACRPEADRLRFFAVTAFSVGAVANGRQPLGYRMILASGRSMEEAIGTALGAFRAAHPQLSFSEPSALEISEASLREIGWAGVFADGELPVDPASRCG